MAGRRGNHEGSIYQRSADGLWCGVALLGYDMRGRMIRKTVTAKSRAEVTRKLAQLRREVDAGKVSRIKTPTLSELMTRWFETVLSREVARSTYDNYYSIVKYHVLPVLGRRKLTDITVADVDRLLTFKLDAGLSPSTVHRVRALISQCLDQGVRWGDVPSNVARLSRPPRMERPEGRTLTREQAQQLLETLKEHRHESLYLLGNLLKRATRSRDSTNSESETSSLSFRGLYWSGPTYLTHDVSPGSRETSSIGISSLSRQASVASAIDWMALSFDNPSTVEKSKSAE